MKLIGEGATDAGNILLPLPLTSPHLTSHAHFHTGGPYFEILSQTCADIQSPPLSLFIPCPNAQIATEQEGSVTNRDKV